ncbi:MAG TPA: histidine kinase dimerization/phosphoacceptor domain -containing protein [Polyangiaceae bacterium]
MTVLSDSSSSRVAELEVRFRTMADHAPVLLWMAGTDGLCDFFNQGWLAFTGRTLDEEFGNGWAEGVHPEDFQRCMHTYLDAFVARRPFSMEYRLRRHDGVYRWIFDQGAPRYDADGKFAGYIGSCVDVSEQRQAREELARMNDELEVLVRERTAIAEERRVLLREVHHRVKNDLQLISSMLGMQARQIDHAESAAALAECSGRVETVARIHEQVYEENRLAGMPFSAGIRSLVAGAFRVASMPRDEVKLEVEADDDIALNVERAIPSGLILNELVRNALKHAFPGGRRGTVRVSVRRPDPGRVALVVSDDGVGIASERSDGSGTALGWQLIEAFAEQLQADVRVTRGPGTTVSVTFALDA